MNGVKENIHMVDISNKRVSQRMAVARGRIYLKPDTIRKILEGKIKKGDPLTVSEIAAINAVKQTPNLLPLCHQIPITNVHCEASIHDDYIEVYITVKTTASTGVEMEALVGVSIYLNNIWDMTKYLEKDENGQYPSTKISDIEVVQKVKKPL